MTYQEWRHIHEATERAAWYEGWLESIGIVLTVGLILFIVFAVGLGVVQL
jgi:hypothetical protein